MTVTSLFKHPDVIALFDDLHIAIADYDDHCRQGAMKWEAVKFREAQLNAKTSALQAEAPKRDSEGCEHSRSARDAQGDLIFRFARDEQGNLVTRCGLCGEVP